MSFSSLLIQSCAIQSKSTVQSGYEQSNSWADVSTGVPCRKDSVPVKISDTGVRSNSDDDLFFFLPGVTIERGNRIVLDGDNYDVIDVNKVYGRRAIHHLEVTARITDHD